MAKVEEFDVELVEEGEEVGFVPILTEEQEEDVLGIIEEGVRKHLADRDANDLESRWAKWRRQRRNVPERDVKNSPFPNASNVSVPLSSIVGKTVYGKSKGAFGGKRPFWRIKALRKNPVDIKIAEVIEKYFNIISESSTDLNLRSKNKEILYESTTMGTNFVKVVWNTEERKFKRVGEGGTEEVTMTVHDGPEWVSIPIEDMYYPYGWRNVTEMPWIAHELHLPWHMVEQRGDNGDYDGIDRLVGWARSEVRDVKRDGVGVEPSEIEVWDILHCFLYYDADEDGISEDLELSIHLPSRTILRVGYNELGIRLFDPFIYMIEPFEVEGIGTCDMVEHMQDEIDTIHNMRIDNMNINGNAMWAAKRNAGIKPNERVRPGKIFFCDTPKEDIVPLTTGYVDQSTVQMEMLSQQYAQRNSGMTDAVSGFPDQVAKSRQGLGLTVNQQQAQMNIFGTILEGLEDSYSRAGMITFFQLVRNRERVLSGERVKGRMSEEDLGVLEQALSIEMSDIPTRFGFSIRTVNADETFEAKRQNILTLTQLHTMFYEKVVPLSLQLFGPQGQQMLQAAPEAYKVMLKAFTSSARLMDKITSFFGEEDTDKYVPEYEKYEALLQIMQQMSGNLGQMGGLNGQEVQAEGIGGRGPVGPGAGIAGAGRGAGAVPGGSSANVGNAGMGVGLETPGV